MGVGEGVRTRSPRRLTRSLIVNLPVPWDVKTAYNEAMLGPDDNWVEQGNSTEWIR